MTVHESNNSIFFQPALVDLTSTAFLEAENQMQDELARTGVTFEGQKLPVSVIPTMINHDEVISAYQDMKAIRDCLNRLCSQIRQDAAAGKSSCLTEFFDDFTTWYWLMGQERRSLEDTMLMRYDMALSKPGRLVAMETNAACPGGVISCAHVKAAWNKTGFGTGVMQNIESVAFPVDDIFGFLKFVFSLAQSKGTPNVAICNYNGVYTNELEILVRFAEELSELHPHEYGNSNLVMCDITDIKEVHGVITAKNLPVSIIYNKIDATMIDGANENIRGWMAAARSETCDFLNSLSAMYVAEAKSAMAALHVEEITTYLNVSDSELQSIKRRLPVTQRVKDIEAYLLSGEVIKLRSNFVLKENYESRGVGILLGSNLDAKTWANHVRSYAQKSGVVQDMVIIPTRSKIGGFEQAKQPEADIEFFGVDMFLFGNEPGGLVGRSHHSSVFNVGSGGMEVPTFSVRKAE